MCACTRDSHIDNAVILRNRHTVEVRLIASQIHRVTLDTSRAVKIETVSYSSVVTFVDADRTILQVPINIGRTVRRTCRQRWIRKQRQVCTI